METIADVAVAGVFMAVLGGALAWLLSLANKRFYVYEDPRINEVEEMLPKSNCGACGTAGCRNFAEQVVAGERVPARCTVNSPDMNATIASFLGVAMGEVEKQVARLACAGGSHVARMRASYQGLSTCRAAATVSGGGKACAWGWAIVRCHVISTPSPWINTASHGWMPTSARPAATASRCVRKTFFPCSR